MNWPRQGLSVHSVPHQRPRTRVQVKPSLMRQFTTNYDRYRDRIVNLSGVQCPSSQVRHADEDCKYEGSVDDAVSIDIHAVVCADIMMHGEFTE